MCAMREWPRSLVVLAVAFAGSVAITLGLTMIVVQDRFSSTDESTPTPMPTISVGAAPTRTGGSLALSGDRTGSFTLDRNFYDVSIEPDFERGFARVEFGRYSLLGDAGAIHIAWDSLEVEQIDFDGLTFYPEPDACTVTPGELNPAIGVASAQLECPDLVDLRGGGTVTIEGGIALPADMLGMRGDLPPSGGRVVVGDADLEFNDARVLVQDALTEDTQREPLFLYGADDVSSIGFERDPESGQLYLTYLVVDDELFEIDDEACEVAAEDVGHLNPITTVQVLSIRCEALDLGSLGVVSIDASLVIDLIVPGDLARAGR